jgi:hypothetical protein
MPNWVYNQVHVHAKTKAQLDKFIAKTTAEIPYVKQDENLPPSVRKENLIHVLEYTKTDFSFWNILSPKKSLWKEYWSVADSEKPDNNWYNWNNTNWGCKWDANNAEIERDDDTYAVVRFETPWGVPIGIMEALPTKFPSLSFTWAWEEEQGFGGEFEIDRDGIVESESYDIPESHADFEERGRTCNCDWLDEEDWYDDCPREDNSHEPLIKIAPDQPTEQENK